MNQEHEISPIVHAVRELVELKKAEFEWRKSHLHWVTNQDLDRLEHKIMATVTEAIAAFAAQMATYNDAEDAAITALEGDVKNLADQIAALQASPGAMPASDQALLDGIQARAKTIADKLAALDALTPPVIPAA